MTSEAITPSAPRRSAARRPASACRRTAAQAAVNGSIALASSAPTMPLRTSPVPAVASAGVAPGLTATAPLGVHDQRVVALEDDDRLRLCGRLAGVVQAPGLDLRAVEAEQAPELALVGGDHGRRGAAGERLEASGVGVEAVGIEDHRDVGALGDGAGEFGGAVTAPEAGARARARRRAR